MRALVLLVAALFVRFSASACSCFGNNSYCETLAPGWFVNPDATAMVVKLTDYHYGITVKVVQTFGGTSLPEDTLTLWGDNGALCRIYLNGIAVGDTVIFGLNETDLMGNTIWNSQYPPNLEEGGDYMVSVCGVYALNVIDGQVSGWIDAPMVQTMSLQDFDAMVTSCTLGVGVEEPVEEENDLTVSYTADGPVLRAALPLGNAQLTIVDAAGRVVLSRGWKGEPLTLALGAAGVYAVRVRHGEREMRERVLGR